MISSVFVLAETVEEQIKALQDTQKLDSQILTEQFYGRWVQIEGRADIVALPDAMDGLVDYYRRVAGEHENWDDYRSAMQRERRVLLRVSLDRAG